REEWTEELIRAQIILSLESIQGAGGALSGLIQAGRIALVGMLNDVRSGAIEVIESTLPDETPIH
nr:hypothetical protein [Pirellula sp.]